MKKIIFTEIQSTVQRPVHTHTGCTKVCAHIKDTAITFFSTIFGAGCDICFLLKSHNLLHFLSGISIVQSYRVYDTAMEFLSVMRCWRG